MVTTILFGLYSAGVAIVLILIEYFTGMDKSGAGTWFGYLNLPFFALFLWLAMKERMQDDFGGTISYGQCVGTGTLVGLWAGVVSAIFMYVYFTAINPSLVDFMIDKQQAAMQTRQMNQTQISNAMVMVKKWFVPMGVIGSLVGSVFLGVLFSLVIGIFVRSKDEPEAIKAV